MNQFSILVVDDEVELGELISEQLRSMEFTVETVISAEDAIMTLENKGFDLVLTDLSMPEGLSGMSICEWVARHRPDETKVLLMTSFIEKFDEERAIELGVAEFIPKPFDFNLLESCIQSVLMNDSLPDAS